MVVVLVAVYTMHTAAMRKLWPMCKQGHCWSRCLSAYTKGVLDSTHKECWWAKMAVFVYLGHCIACSNGHAAQFQGRRWHSSGGWFHAGGPSGSQVLLARRGQRPQEHALSRSFFGLSKSLKKGNLGIWKLMRTSEDSDKELHEPLLIVEALTGMMSANRFWTNLFWIITILIIMIIITIFSRGRKPVGNLLKFFFDFEIFDRNLK